MDINNFRIYYEGIEYVSSSQGEISVKSRGISVSPYKVLADMLRKYRISRSRYEIKEERRDLRARVEIEQHDLWYAHEASVNFTVYWHPGLSDGAFHIYKFKTRVGESYPHDYFEIRHNLIDYDKYMVTLSRWDTDLQALLGSEITFIPILIVTAMRDNGHALWDRGKAKGMKLEM